MFVCYVIFNLYSVRWKLVSLQALQVRKVTALNYVFFYRIAGGRHTLKLAFKLRTKKRFNFFFLRSD